MCRINAKNMKASCAWPAIVLGLMGVLSGCYMVKSKSDVTGTYELKVDANKISLDVLQDGRYEETITWANGHVEKRAGQWTWWPGHIGFDDLWIPKDFAPDSIRRADESSSSNRPKFTEPIAWSMSAENHWGTVILPVFPDEDVNFRMIRHSK